MISLIFLAGGKGTRMGAPLPKQFLSLRGKLLAHHSYELFLKQPQIKEIVVVCEEEYRSLFQEAHKFAMPGLRRQDSVYSGLKKCSQELILIHDAARPFVDPKHIAPLCSAALEFGAAALASPVTSTIKQCSKDKIVQKTLERSSLWEIQTPQAVKKDLFLQGYKNVYEKSLEVTDDLSVVETIGCFGKIIEAPPNHMKITTPFDLHLAEQICATN